MERKLKVWRSTEQGWETLLKRVDRFYRLRRNEFFKRLNSGKKRYYFYVAGVGGGSGAILGKILSIESSPMTIISAGGIAACISWASIELNKESKNKDAEEKVYDKFENSIWKMIEDFGEEAIPYRDKWGDLRVGYLASEEKFYAKKEGLNEVERKLDLLGYISGDDGQAYDFFACSSSLKDSLPDKKTLSDMVSELNEAKHERLGAAEKNKNFKMSMISWENKILKGRDKSLFYFSRARSFAHIKDEVCDNFESKLDELVCKKIEYINELEESVGKEQKTDLGVVDEIENLTKEVVFHLKEIRDMAYASFEERSLHFKRSVRLIFSLIVFIASLSIGYNMSWEKEVQYFAINHEAEFDLEMREGGVVENDVK